MNETKESKADNLDENDTNLAKLDFCLDQSSTVMVGGTKQNKSKTQKKYISVIMNIVHLINLAASESYKWQTWESLPGKNMCIFDIYS